MTKTITICILLAITLSGCSKEESGQYLKSTSNNDWEEINECMCKYTGEVGELGAKIMDCSDCIEELK